MKKKIMFNDKFCLTQAVLGGTKTQTRRIEALQPSARMFDEIGRIEGGFDDKGRWMFTMLSKDGGIIGNVIPKYNVGDVAAIAQSYKDIYAEKIANFAKHNYHIPREDAAEKFRKLHETCAGWENKMFVKAGLMSHHIRITDVKVERLQDISDEDILREGVWQFHDVKDLYYISKTIGYAPTVAFPKAREAFWYLIDKISGNGTWKRNPLVVVYEFEKVD